MKSAKQIEMSRVTMEDIIHGEVNRFLRAGGFLQRDEEVFFTLPVKDTFMLPIRMMKEISQERVVCTVL